MINLPLCRNTQFPSFWKKETWWHVPKLDQAKLRPSLCLFWTSESFATSFLLQRFLLVNVVVMWLHSLSMFSLFILWPPRARLSISAWFSEQVCSLRSMCLHGAWSMFVPCRHGALFTSQLGMSYIWALFKHSHVLEQMILVDSASPQHFAD